MRKKGNRGVIEDKNPVDIRDKENSVVTALFKPCKLVNTLSNEELHCLMTTNKLE